MDYTPGGGYIEVYTSVQLELTCIPAAIPNGLLIELIGRDILQIAF